MLLEEFIKKPTAPKKLVEQVEKLAEETPDFTYINYDIDLDPGTYLSCSYVGPAVIKSNVSYEIKPAPNQPESKGCIIGQALQNCGVEDVSSIEFKRIDSVLKTFPKETIEYLQQIQRQQDLGQSWGEAIKLSIKKAKDE